MSDNSFPIGMPDPVRAALWASMGRHALTLGGGALAAFGLSLPSWLASLTDPQLNIIISAVMFFGGAAMSVVGTLWAWWDKRQARRLQVASARASAESGVPVTVTVTPVGQPNIASRISATEMAAAPVVPAGVTPSPAPRAP